MKKIMFAIALLGLLGITLPSYSMKITGDEVDLTDVRTTSKKSEKKLKKNRKIQALSFVQKDKFLDEEFDENYEPKAKQFHQITASVKTASSSEDSHTDDNIRYKGKSRKGKNKRSKKSSESESSSDKSFSEGEDKAKYYKQKEGVYTLDDITVQEMNNFIPASVSESDSDATQPEPFKITYFSPGILPVFLRAINQENKGIFAAVYSFDNKDIAQTLVKRAKKIDDFNALIILSKEERINLKEVCDKTRKKAEVQILLKKNNIPVLFNKQKMMNSEYFDESMHHKFCLFFDNNGRPLLITGSYNWTDYAENKSRENITIIDDPHAIMDYLKAFKILYASCEPRNANDSVADDYLETISAPICKRVKKLMEKQPRTMCAHFSIPLIKSPQQRLSKIIENLFSQEKVGIIAVQNYFTLYNLAKIWQERVKEVKANGKPFHGSLTVDKDYSEQLCSAINHLIINGVRVFTHTENKKLHHKFILFQSNKDKKTYVLSGSFNLTGNAENKNWEDFYISEDQEAFDFFCNEYEELKSCRNPLTHERLVEERRPYNANLSFFTANRLNKIPSSLLDPAVQRNSLGKVISKHKEVLPEA